MPKKRSLPTPNGLPEKYLRIEEIYQAYKKAKVDTFFEKDLSMDFEFVAFEKELHVNLGNVRTMLLTGSWVNDAKVLGDCTFIPKDLSFKSEGKAQMTETLAFKTIHTDSRRAWNERIIEEASRGHTPEVKFRPIAQPSVEWAVISAFWIMKAGRKLDQCLSNAARGSRLRTYKNGDYHQSAIGSFAHYAPAYKKWREDGLQAIRRELDGQKGCIAITADLRSFYHSVDSSFVNHIDFQKLITSLETSRNATKSDAEKDEMDEMDWNFTIQICESFRAWVEKNRAQLNTPKIIGLPIGLGAARVIANLSLMAFDRFIQQEIQPLYYGRYVDDVFLVLPDGGGSATGSDVWERITKLSVLDESKSCKIVREAESEESDEVVYRVHQNYDANVDGSSRSNLRFGGEKQKSFFIEGAGGRALLETIEDQIRCNSSEWRKLPEIPSFHDDFRILSLTDDAGTNDSADSLRKANRVSIRRLRFALHLRDLEAIAEDLEPRLGIDARIKLYNFAECQLLVLPEFFVYATFVPRIFGLAIFCQDWEAALSLIIKIEVLFRQIFQACGQKTTKTQAELCYQNLIAKIKIALCRALPWDSDKFLRSSSEFDKLIGWLNQDPKNRSSSQKFYRDSAQQFYFSDLGRIPFKNSLLAAYNFTKADRFKLDDFPDDTVAKLRLIDLQNFALTIDGNTEGIPAAMVFPTRPLLPAEIGLLDPSLLSAERASQFEKYVTSIRGTHFKAIDSGKRGQLIKWFGEEMSKEILWVPEADFSSTVRVSLPCIALSDESWAASIVQQKDPDLNRYTRVTRLMNEILGSDIKPHYIVLPELALKSHWFNRFAAKLEKSGISLISGVEYRHHPFEQISPDTVVNSVRVSLVTRFPGYRTHLLYSQNKQRPAPGERSGLMKIGGKQLTAGKSNRMIVRHGDFQFSILICSELSDIQARARLRGQIDALFVPEWNTDTPSFASLVESTAADLHCFIIQSNNRNYGDSRIRAPFKNSWERDVVRLNGGASDFHATGEIDFMLLRRFQSNHQSLDRTFKPVPDGFELHPSRKELPLIP